MKDNAIEHTYYDVDIEKIIMNLSDEKIKEKLKSNSKKFLTKYLVNYGNSSKKLIDNMKKRNFD